MIQKMNSTMRDRGPDGTGYWIDEKTGVTLGHTRLAILDLSTAGAQPMLSESKRWVLSYNGEIYNFRDIKNELIKNEIVSFRSNSDTEVLLEAFSRWGIRKTLDKVRGMYAISLYDRERKKLYLVRDCMGEKPIYYGFVNGIFVWGSDLKAIYQIENFKGEINKKALNLYFKYGYIPSPYSIYEGIYKLQPGTILTTNYPFTEYRIEYYWNINVVAEKMRKTYF